MCVCVSMPTLTTVVLPFLIFVRFGNMELLSMFINNVTFVFFLSFSFYFTSVIALYRYKI